MAKDLFLDNNPIEQRDILTVIIPTLLKRVDLMEWTLGQLSENKLVKEILVIDNTEKKLYNSSMNKVKIIKEKDNLFVNPAWNLGVNKAKTDYFLLLNDDVLCDNSVIKECMNVILNTVYELIFVFSNEETIDRYEKQVSRNNELVWYQDLKNVSMNELSGSFIMGKKINWKFIPELMKVFCGDNWILEHNRDRSAIVKSTYVSHFQATTAKDLYDTQLKEDNAVWERYSKIWQQ